MVQLLKIISPESISNSVNYDVLFDLKDSLGDQKYNEAAEDTAYMLADHLGKLERAMNDKNMESAYCHAVNVRSISARFGLVAVSKIARDVAQCAKQEDLTSLAAVVGRLNRSAEAHIFSIFLENT